jgi:Tfp pilus assembly protein PilN
MMNYKAINLLPWKAKKNRRVNFLILFSVVLLLSFLSILLLNRLIAYQVKQLNLYKIGLVNQLSALSLSIEKIQSLKQQIKQLKSIQQRLHTNHVQIRKILVLLDEFSVLTSPYFVIHAVDYQAPYLSLLVSVDSEKKFLKLIDKNNRKLKYVRQQGPHDFVLKFEL